MREERTDARDPMIARVEKITAQDSYFRTALEQSWFINHINYLGYQWTLVDPDTGSLEEIPNEVRFRANLMQSRIAARVAKVTSLPPDWDVDSDTDSTKVQQARKVAEKFLEYVWDKESMQVKSREFAFFVSIYGTGLIGITWDAAYGKRLDPDEVLGQVDMEQDIPQLLEAFGGDGKSMIEWLEGKKEIRDGDIKIQVLNPFDVYVDPAASDEESASWVLLKRLMSVDDVKEVYDEDVTPEALGDGSGPTYKYRLWQLASPNVVSGGTSSMSLENVVEVKEFWERPTPKRPKGRLFVYANGVVLRDGDNPFNGLSAEIPLARARDLPRLAGFWGISTTESAIPLQRSYNKARSDVIQAEHDQAAPKIMVPRGCGIKQGAFDRTSNELVDYTALSIGSGQPLRPWRLDGAQVSSLHTVSIEQSNIEMDEVFGLSDISKGNAPKGVSAGVALDILLKESDIRLGGITAEMTAAYARVGKMVLDVAKRFISDEYVFTEVSGEGASPEIYSFMSTDLSTKNVRVRMGSIVERRRMRRQQTGIELLQYGGAELFSGPDAKKALFTASGFGDALPDVETAFEKRAKKIISQIKQGIEPPIHPWHDHNVIIEKMGEWMNEPEFDEESEMVQALAMQHFQMRLAQMQPPPMDPMDPMAGATAPGQAPVDEAQGVGTPQMMPEEEM